MVMKISKIKYSRGEWTFQAVIYFVLALLVASVLFPFIYIFSTSISDPLAVTQGRVWFMPVGLNFTSYQRVFAMNDIWIAYANTIFYAVVGTSVALLVTTCGAYPLSRKKFPGQKFVNMFVLLTMWFNAGIIPFYLNIKNLNLLNNRMTLIIAFACSAFYVVIMRTYFQSIPDAMEESAKLDGANDWQILFRIIIPLSTPVIATIGLYYFVERWNSYFWAMTIMTDSSKIPLQVLLRKLVVQMNMAADSASDIVNTTRETMIYATIMVAVVPMIVLYPFVQKFFVKGIMIGAVKG